jgi:Rrf2 family protein
MKLTTKSEYALLALVHIARHQKDGFVKTEQICSKYHIPKKYLEQLLMTLKQNRLLKTRRGASGGYQLTPNAQKTSLARIIRIMDGPLASTESVSKYFFSRTPLSQEKKLLVPFREIRNYIDQKLEKIKLKDLTQND